MPFVTGNRTEYKYIYELPYTERKCLCNILDINDQWERLGGEKMGFSVLELSEMKRAERCGDSPTDRLLQHWGRKNNTILNLYCLLYSLEHFQAMNEYHYERLHEDLVMKSNSTPKAEEDSVRVATPQPLPKPDPKLLSSNRIECAGPSPTGAKAKVPQHYPREAVNENSEPLQAVKILNTEITLGRQDYEEYKSIEDNLQVNHSKATPKKVVEEDFKPKVNMKEQAQAQGNTSSHSLKKTVPVKNQLLGSGGFGSVYKGTWINVNVAIKKINQIQKELPNSSSMHMSQVLDELRFLQKYRHDNILQVYGFSADPDQPHCLVYQFMSNGSLEYRLQCKKIEAFSESTPSPLTWSQRFNIAKGTAAALQFLHTVQEKPLIHGDVKSANILLDGYLQPKLGDFGLAREGPHSEYTSMKVSHVHGTRPYIPEEYLRSKKLSTKVDTYSFGIVLFEISSGKRAYNDKTKKNLHRGIFSRPVFPNTTSNIQFYFHISFHLSTLSIYACTSSIYAWPADDESPHPLFLSFSPTSLPKPSSGSRYTFYFTRFTWYSSLDEGIPVPQQEIRTLSPEPGRPSQGFCPSPQPALQKGREENVQMAPPQIPMIPDISRLILQSSSEMPEEQISSDNSSSSSSSDSSEEESELQMDMSGSHESLPAANSNNNAAASPKDSKKESRKVPTEVCIPLLTQLGTVTRPPAGNNSNTQSEKGKKTVSAQGKSTFLD
ncbi:Serine/threonine-protein kinase pelle [Armadillidium vulgare]|nr:Serine/threonine-protein kinase pelle [Armadillidium vulgare]